MIYLDTHVALWLFFGRVNLLSDNVKNFIEENDIFISPIVELEMEYLYELEKISVKTSKIIATLEDEVGLRICSKDFSKIIKKSLKSKWTRDPFDRIITAQASLNNNILITKDRNIKKHYSNAKW